MPLSTLHLEQIGEPNWRRPAYGETVKTYWQWFALIPGRDPHWRITTFTNAARLVHDGSTIYRVPCSFRAWCTVVPQWIRKTWRAALGKDAL